MREYCSIKKENKEVLKAQYQGGMYQLLLQDKPFTVQEYQVLQTTKAIGSLPLWMWHRRLGHLNVDNIRKLVKESAIDIYINQDYNTTDLYSMPSRQVIYEYQSKTCWGSSTTRKSHLLKSM